MALTISYKKIMHIPENYTLEIQAIKQMISDLKNGHIYENDPVPGMPKCNILGQKLEIEFDALLKKIETDTPGNIQIAGSYLPK